MRINVSTRLHAATERTKRLVIFLRNIPSPRRSTMRLGCVCTARCAVAAAVKEWVFAKFRAPEVPAASPVCPRHPARAHFVHSSLSEMRRERAN